MAYDYYIVNSDSPNVVRDRLALPLNWVTERHPKMVSQVSYGEVDYYGNYTREEALAFAESYGESFKEMIEEYAEYASSHRKALEYVQNSPSDEFIISAIYWTSDEY